MDTLEYRKLLSTLDSQLDRAKQEAEIKARREQLETHIKLVAHQTEQLRTRKEQFEKLGVTPPVDLNPILEKLALDKASLEQQLLEPPPAPEKGMDQEDRDEMVALLRAIDSTPVSGLTQEERWVYIESWSLQWRILADRVGQKSVGGERLFSKVYAMLRTVMDCEPEAPQRFKVSEPLTRPKPGAVSSADWEARLEAVGRRRKIMEEARRRDEDQARLIDEDMKGFSSAFTNHQVYKTGDTDKALRHAIRTAGRHVHLRPELADALQPYRNTLNQEFGFLWDDGPAEAEADPKQTLTNRDIAARLLRRMKSKTLIGACHGPEDRISKGFPPHYMGKAKELVDVLVKSGVIRRKDNAGELRVSLEPTVMPQVEAFLGGAAMGIRDVDAWCEAS